MYVYSYAIELQHFKGAFGNISFLEKPMMDATHSASHLTKADMPNGGHFASRLPKGSRFASLLPNAGRIVSLVPNAGRIVSLLLEGGLSKF